MSSVGGAVVDRVGTVEGDQPQVDGGLACGVFGDKRLLMHASLVVSPVGLPLGLAAAQFWTRAKFKGTNDCSRRPRSRVADAALCPAEPGGECGQCPQNFGHDRIRV